jgi:hypothetical protein
MNFVTVFRTGQLWEIDMARDALKQAQVPHFVREESLSGVISAFQATPAPGIGITWCLQVPETIVEDAKLILSELPIDLNKQPGYWDFTSDKKFIKAAKFFIWVILIVIIITLLIGFFSKLF